MRWSEQVRAVALAIAAALALPGALAAQRVSLEGDRSGDALSEIARILAGNEYLLIDRDTTLDERFRHSGDVVIAGATVRLEGEVTGRVAVLGGELFVRPGARIGGPIAVAGGAVYPSGLAEIGPILESPPGHVVDVNRLGGRYVVVATPPPPAPRLRSSGVFGLVLPTYDRVDGLTLGVGGSARLSSDKEGARLRGDVRYHSRRGALGGTVALELPLSPAVWATAEVGRETRTNEEWIRGPLTNSLAGLATASDARNYYEADAVSLRIARLPTQPLIAGEAFAGPWIGAQAARERSLAAGDPRSLTGDWRPNPRIDDGTVISMLGGLVARWTGTAAQLAGDVAVEWAPGSAGDFDFARVVVDGIATISGLREDQLSIRGRTHQTLGGAPAPRQRWSFLGGTNTLPTLDFDSIRGDRLVFIESVYSLPLPLAPLPLVGAPALRLVHATGTAWVTGEAMPRWTQNVAAGLRFSLVEAHVYVDPAADPIAPLLSLGLVLPF